jgi:hypothetical protein
MTEANAILHLLAPPIRLLNWLEKLIAAKEAKGEKVPEEFTEWMQRWVDIRGDGLAITDYLPDDVWAAIGEKVSA